MFYFVNYLMKKYLFSIILLFVFFVSWCGNTTKNDNSQSNVQDALEQLDVNELLKTIVKNHESCGDCEMFVDISVLWNSENNNWNMEYYLVTNGEWFKIDERWNLGDVWGFGEVPTTIELSKDEIWYNLVNYQTAKDWSEYDSSTKEMFSEKAYKIREDGKYTFVNDKTLLQQAEEYFGVTIIPEWETDFECKFCDKLWYYEPYDDMNLHTNDLVYNYISEDNWNNTVYFGSDWTFEAKWSRDEWIWTRSFGQDENTIIVLNNNLNHVYDRYIITNQTDTLLNTILEIIQRR